MQATIESEIATSGMSVEVVPMAPWPALAPMGRSLAEPPKGVSRLYYFDSAPGDRVRRAIVLIHGLGDEGDSFRHLFPPLSADFRLIAPDLPGFGRSGARGRTSFRLCVESVAAILEAEGIEGAIVLGSSLGASIAQLLASRLPGAVAALVLEDGGSPAPNKAATSLLSMALPFFGKRRYEGFRKDRAAAVRSLSPYYADWETLPEADRNFLARRVADRVDSAAQGRAYLSLLRSAMMTLGFSGGAFARQLDSWNRPLSVIWGAEDRVVSRESGRIVAARVEGATFALVEGAGHLPHQERPAAVADILRASARALERTRAPAPGHAKAGN